MEHDDAIYDEIGNVRGSHALRGPVMLKSAFVFDTVLFSVD